MPAETATPLTEEQLAELWAEHDRLRREIETLDKRFQQVQDRLMQHIPGDETEG